MQSVFLKLYCIKDNGKCITDQRKKNRDIDTHIHQLVKMSEKEKQFRPSETLLTHECIYFLCNL